CFMYNLMVHVVCGWWLVVCGKLFYRMKYIIHKPTLGMVRLHFLFFLEKKKKQKNSRLRIKVLKTLPTV
ncbi:MAG: hypothetical protein ABIS69_01795, partial [Sediminibacterium sp.]